MLSSFPNPQTHKVKVQEQRNVSWLYADTIVGSLYKIELLHEAPASYSLLLSIMNATWSKGMFSEQAFTAQHEYEPVHGQLTAGEQQWRS